MQKLQIWLSFLGILFLAQACQVPDEVSIEKSQIEVAFPILHTEMSIADMIGNTPDSTALKVYADSRMSLLYEGEVVSKDSEGILGKIPENKIPIVDPIMDAPLDLLNGVQINVALIKSGFLHYRFTNDTVTQDIVVNFTVPQLIKNGVTFTTQINIPAGNGLPASFEDSLDMSGYDLDVSAGILSFYHTALTTSGDTVVLAIDTDFGNPTKSYVNLSDVVFSYVEGHWNTVDQDFDAQTIEIDFFENNFVNGEIYFDDPKVDFTITSSFGLPVRTKLNYFRIVEKDGSVVDMESQYLADGIDFNYPTLAEVGQSKETSFSFNKSNSNIAELLNTNPIRIEYDIDVTVNPDNLSSSIGFATDSSSFTMIARAELPLIGRVNSFISENEFDVDFGDKDAKDGVLKIASDNELPLEVGIQLYFLDDNGAVLDSLHTGDFAVILAAADFPGPSSKHAENEFPIDAQKWSVIRKTKKIRLKGSYTSSQDGQQIVTFLASQKTKIKVGLKLKL